jgi:hypothetical protein
MDSDKLDVTPLSKVPIQTGDITPDLSNIEIKLHPPLTIPSKGNEDKSIEIPIVVPLKSQTIEEIKLSPSKK